MRRDALSTNRRGHRAGGMGQRRRRQRRRVPARAVARETFQARSLPSCGCGTRLGQPIRAASGTLVDHLSGGNRDRVGRSGRVAVRRPRTTTVHTRWVGLFSLQEQETLARASAQRIESRCRVFLLHNGSSGGPPTGSDPSHGCTIGGPPRVRETSGGCRTVLYSCTLSKDRQCSPRVHCKAADRAVVNL